MKILNYNSDFFELQLFFLVLLILVILTLIFSFPKFISLLKRLKQGEDIDFIISKFNLPSIENLEKTNVFLLPTIKKLFGVVDLLIIPIFFFRMALIAKFGIRISWRLPFNLYEIFYFFIFVL